MTRQLNKLTTPSLKTALAGKLEPGLHADGGGLYLAIGPSGSASWVFRYMLRGRSRSMGLGSLADIAAPEARGLAQRHRTELAGGADPIDLRDSRIRQAEAEQQRVQSSRVSFRTIADQVLDEVIDKSQFTANYKRTWRTSLSIHVHPRLGALTLDQIDRAVVLDCLRAIWSTIPSAARGIRQRIEFIFDEARDRNLTDKPNPARWADLKRGLAHYHPVKAPRKHPALPWQDTPAFYTALKAEDGYAPMALRLSILAATRGIEARGARFDEFDFDSWIWTVPAERMKGKPGARLTHYVPITSDIADLVRTLETIRRGPFLFPHRDRRDCAMSPAAMQQVLNKKGLRGKVTIHGFRSTFKDWSSDNGYDDKASERSLAHQVTGVAGHYDRTTMLEMRRDLLQQWNDFVAGRLIMQAPQARRRPQLAIANG